MKTLDRRFTLVAGVLLLFPALYFIVAALLNYEMGLAGLWKPISSIFENPANKIFGWNINLLILFGPVLALLLNLFSVVKIQWKQDKEQLYLNSSIRKHWINIAIVALTALVLAALSAYLITENIHWSQN